METLPCTLILFIYRSQVQDRVGMLLSTELPTDYHHNSIVELSIRWVVGKVGEGFPGWVLPKTLKWVAVYSTLPCTLILFIYRSQVQDRVGMLLSTELPTDYHHNSIVELSIRLGVGKVGEGFPGWVLPKTLKWVAVYSSVTFHID